MTNSSNLWAKKRRNELMGNYRSKCIIPHCDSEVEDLHFAHVSPTGLKGRGRGRKERLCDISKNPKCYILLCKEHHDQYDHSVPEIVELVTSIKERIYCWD
jgi:hypothetical protein